MTDSIELHSDISPVSLEDEMKRSYIDYAMSVIVSRALPDVRDGLKPVHRRILFAMKEGGNEYNRPYRKSARVVGDVIGKYHPHGEGAVYDSMVRMAQDFSMSAVLIDGQGNYGSMDGDPPAAMRYTETRLSQLAHFLLEDLDKKTVNYRPNYDESLEEPVVLPARYPNLLVNGAGGIAVGMATNIPPHNLGEVIDACILQIDNPFVTDEEMMEVIKGPDFPTGGQILGRHAVREAFLHGRGSVLMRAKTHIEEIRKDRMAIVATEIPYQVNKARLVERIAETVTDKIIEGISDLRDESDRDGVRVVIELKRDATPEVVLNQLFKHTPLQTSFGVNLLALHEGRPLLMGIRRVLECFIEFREQVITNRTRFDLLKAQDRAHILIGLAIAVANIDPMIELIKKASDPQIAREKLMEIAWPAETVASLLSLIQEESHKVKDGKYLLSENQARAILDLRLHRLTGLERDKIAQELEEIIQQIKEFLAILASKPRRLEIMKTELLEIKEKFSVPRRTEIIDHIGDQDYEDLIEREDMVVTVSHAGYIKRVPLSTYRAQRRGGKGKTGMQTRDEDFVNQVFIANTHIPVFFFSSKGKVYQMKTYRLPLGSAQSRGKAMINLLPLEEGEIITTVLALPEEKESWENLYILFATSLGNIRRNRLSDFSNIRSNGLIAIKLDDNEKLIGVHLCEENQDILIATRLGKSIRFPLDALRVFAGRSSNGVRAIRLGKGDLVNSLSVINATQFTPEEREAYLRKANKDRRGEEIDFQEEDSEEERTSSAFSITEDLYRKMAEEEQFILTITENGYAKRTSSYAYRRTNRGGQGVVNMTLGTKTGNVISSFPIENEGQVILVTDQGQLIRCPVHDIRICGRQSQGVILFRVGKDEKVASTAVVREDNGEEELEEEIETSHPELIQDESSHDES
ncbi:MAG: DNA gyrase subunit A [Proteobacteria bacterium]|nr:DNA gyrase subunit A [Pseudomonadota bacterium]